MNKVFVLGDIHGRFQPIRDFCTYMNSKKSTKLDPTDTIILLGDVGANFFFNDRDKEFKKKLGTYNIIFFCIRGNHEERPEICAYKNPDEWHQETYFDNWVWVENDYPYIKYAQDYPDMYIINGRSCMIFPGAYSVDKQYRLRNNWSWFENEQLTPEEMEIGHKLVEKYEKCDIVLSHTCPLIYEPTDLFIKTIDQSTVDKTMERYLGNIERHLKYKIWLWGHYHRTRIYPRFNDNDIVMLFDDKMFDLDKYFEIDNPYDAMIEFHHRQLFT